MSQSLAFQADSLDFSKLQYQRALNGDVDFHGLAYSNPLTEGAYTTSAGRIDVSETFVGLKNPNRNLRSRLFRLRTNLALHHSQAISQSQETTGEDFTSLNVDGDTGQPDSTGRLRFEDALHSISKFVSIIEDYDKELRSANTSPSRRTISVDMILDILLAYLQLVEIYDGLCCQLLAGLRDNPRSAMSELQILPSLQIAGFSVEQGYLQTKLLIQAIRHHFEMIEKLFGLLVPYRISSRT
jgi:hypothetical protein